VIDVDPIRIEEAGLNALQTQQQLFFDGWLLRVSPGKAKRARSVNPHFGSSLPLDAKIDRCEGIYAARGLPALFRITPFCKPADLEPALERRGYVVFDPTLVQAVKLACAPTAARSADVQIVAPPIAEFVDAVAELRASSPAERAAHRERLAFTPLATYAVIASLDGRPAACGQAALDDGFAGIYDMVTAPALRDRGIATTIVTELLGWARERGASHAFLQVNDDNAAALAVYRRFGFETVYRYHYRARPNECR
jgi:ribosomal protein S18 acetylase RimI-like enzyme